jgi:U1 small nuclear ribonucleoprotein of 70kDa MW N terminal
MSGGGLNLAAKLEAERKLKEGISGHRTGLPKRLLELFAPLDPLKILTPFKKRPPRVPYKGIAEYVQLFAEPGDPAYEPPRPEGLPAEPRQFRNPELDAQARVDKESLLEKCVFMPPPFLCPNTPPPLLPPFPLRHPRSRKEKGTRVYRVRYVSGDNALVS